MAGKRQERVIDKLPGQLKKQVIDAMMSGSPSREISRMIQANGGPYVSHVAVSGYRKEVLRPAIQTAAKIQQLQHLPSDSGGMIQQAAELTGAVIAADPILAQVAEQRALRAQMTQRAVADGDVKGFAAVDRNELASIELHAKLTGRLQQTAGTTTQIMIVVPDRPQAEPAPEEEGGMVIDVVPE